jgi:hypothetical protein
VAGLIPLGDDPLDNNSLGNNSLVINKKAEIQNLDIVGRLAMSSKYRIV